MGWTYQSAKFYKENGSIDRKAECDNMCNWEGKTKKYKVLKSVMKGRVYYAAGEETDKVTGETKVFAWVILTGTDSRSWYNFGHKMMDESVGPFECDCPKSILELLTEPRNDYAREWRERCWANINAPKKTLASVKIGEVIEFGPNRIRVRKMAPAYQFKTPWFYREDNNTYVKKNHIKDWTLVETA